MFKVKFDNLREATQELDRAWIAWVYNGTFLKVK